jgi:hypothetical protein
VSKKERGGSMLDNNLYNLMMQMVGENKSAWRIKTNYEQDAAGCDECLTFWKSLLEDKERYIEEIRLSKKSGREVDGDSVDGVKYA